MKKQLPDLLNEIPKFADNGVICKSLDELAKELTEDLDYSSEKTYWIKEAIDNMNGMFELLMDIKKQSLVSESKIEPANASGFDESMPVEDLDLTARTKNHLVKQGIFTLRHLLLCSSLELLTIEGFGKSSLTDVEALLSSYGLKLVSGGPDTVYTSTLKLTPETSMALQGRSIRTLDHLQGYGMLALLQDKVVTKMMMTEIVDKLAEQGLSM